jgi:hypothetical protein
MSLKLEGANNNYIKIFASLVILVNSEIWLQIHSPENLKFAAFKAATKCQEIRAIHGKTL